MAAVHDNATMGANPVEGETQAADRRTDSQVVQRPHSVSGEQLQLRSYDHEWAYDLEIEIADDSGSTVFEERYYLQPGHAQSLTDILPSGMYDLTVTVDNRLQRSLQCHIDDSVKKTAVIEVGNGTVSLTTGNSR